ncbi:M64 family metallo-endopeptidase [Gammaproteobacteria bacterium]|nr:M64 family metallo-endopeptidase [Gammaproteobacteria bacterium]MDC0420974.1 M64 family metallo-endopeptidase [Gammaproteobacteria bacterium]|tara:strand:- start:2558 stop:4693 length:2136 start_codon:yes stop_codon:yes gene_type:complete
MKRLYLLSLIFIISSCGGGGGGGGGETPSSGTPPTTTPFQLSIGLTSFTVNEDESYSASLAATANEQVTLNYAITSSVSNGSLSLSSSGNITYQPNENFFGSDQFQYSVTAVEKNVTQSATVSITVNSVNDLPSISFVTTPNTSKDTLLYDANQTFQVTVDDVDNQISELSFDIKLGDEIFNGTFTSDTDNPSTGEVAFNLLSLQNAGLYDAEVRVFDGEDYDFVTFEAWFVSNRSELRIQQDDDPEDGFDGGEKSPKDYKIYYLSGGPSAMGRTKYLFIGDSLNNAGEIELYRRALLASVNKLNDSDANDFFNKDYFSIISAEPVKPDGSSPVGIRTGCYDWDEDVYCIDDMDTAILDELLPSYTLVSVLTRVQGRGVNLGDRNIQRILESDPERTKNTLMHELGHAHGYMGDEYRTDDDRDVSEYADDSVNTTTQSDVSFVKWNHKIEDLVSVLGKDIKVCYNTGDGRIYDRDANQYIEGNDCACLVNEWGAPETDPTTGEINYPFIRKNPDCNKVGLFEGNYYGEFDNYRPTFCSIMDSCNEGGYGAVNVEGFAVGSIQNQGFYYAFNRDTDEAKISFNEDASGVNESITVDASDIKYDTEQITIKWYVDGVEDTSKENQKRVTFSRPADNSVAIYTIKAIDLTGTITAEDDVIDNTDFYEGMLQSYFIWNDGTDFDYDPDPSTYSNYDYGYMNGPLGFSWGINWASW